MIIGVDIDGVIADSLYIWVQELNRYFKQTKTIQDVTEYRFDRVYNVTWEQMDYFFRAYQEALLTNLLPVQDAKACLQRLVAEHQLIMITARPEAFRELTESWLDQHQIPYEDLFMTDYGDKSKYCKEKGIELYIEDSIENAQSIAKLGIPVILFDAPYNQWFNGEGILRRFNWGEIYRTIRAMQILSRRNKD